MNTNNIFQELVRPTDLCLDFSDEIQEQAWQQSQSFFSLESRWRAYLNQLCLEVFLPWLQENFPQASLCEEPDFYQQTWEFVNGLAINFDNKKLILISSDAIDTEEINVPQEWVDIPSFAGDYYLAIQVDTEENLLRVWGYTKHKILKEKGSYNESDRSYFLDSDDLIEDLNVLWVTHQLCPDEITQSEIQLLPSLSLARSLELVNQLNNTEIIFPRLMVAFPEWGFLLSHANFRRMLWENRQPNQQNLEPAFSPLVNLSQWFQGIFTTHWEAVTKPEWLLGYRTFSVTRNKLIDLGIQINTTQQRVSLQVILVLLEEQELDILVRLHRDDATPYLPPGIKLIILDENGEIFQEVTARDTDQLIQYQFQGSAGERFFVKVALGEFSITEEFVI